MGEVGLGAVQILEERKDPALDMLQHVLGRHVLEVSPTQGAFIDTILARVLGPDVDELELGFTACELGSKLGRNPDAVEF